MNGSRRKTNAASAVLLFCAAGLFTMPAPAAINGVSAPRLLLTCLNFQQSAAKVTVLTCKATNVSSTSGGQAPVIRNLMLLVGGSIVKMTPSSVSSGGVPSYSDAMTFPAGTYRGGTSFAVEGVAVDGIFGNTAGSPTGTQFVASNSLTVIDPAQPPEPTLPGDPPGNCTYEATLSSTPLNFPAEGGNASIVVDTETDTAPFPKGCPWAPSTHNGAATVIQFTGHGAPQTGPGVAPFQVLPNTVVNGSSSPRVIVMPETSGTANAVDVIGPAAAGFVPGYYGSFQISQDGLTCAYTASGFAVPESGLSASNPGVVTITATGQTVPGDGSKAKTDPNCQWKVTSSSPQLTIVGGTSVTTGSGKFQFYVPANTSPTAHILQFSLGTLVFQTSQPGTQPVSITLTTNPAVLSLVADGTTYTVPHTFSWTVGSMHRIGTASPQGSGGTQYVFGSWSQGGAQSQTITVPAANAAYTAHFTTHYQLTTAVSPAGSGAVTPSSGGFFAAGSTVHLTATANSGYVFTSWNGAVSSAHSASTTIVINGPELVTAEFSAPSQTTHLRINAGGGAYTDTAGNVWSADTGFFGGTTFSTGSPIKGTVDQPLYQTQRQGTFSYQFNMPNGDYLVNLKFAVLNNQAPGKNTFNVSINGLMGVQPGLLDFDPAVAAGGDFTAIDERFLVAVKNRQLRIDFGPNTSPAAVNAIEVAPAYIRINAGGPSYTAPDGTRWSADTGFSAPGSISTTSFIANTTTPQLYQTEHAVAGGFNYRFAVPNGPYNFVLKFAEIVYPGAGSRKFNVLINGNTVLSAYDPAAAAGAFTAQGIGYLANVTNGQIVIDFVPVEGEPTVSAIEILPATVIRVNCGGPTYTDKAGNRWNADYSLTAGTMSPNWGGYSGGTAFQTSSPVSRTSDPQLYQTERTDQQSFVYAFDVPDGTYDVVLHFADIGSPWGLSSGYFTVTANGTPAGPFQRPMAAEFVHLNATVSGGAAGGVLIVTFNRGTGYPFVNAIEVLSVVP